MLNWILDFSFHLAFSDLTPTQGHNARFPIIACSCFYVILSQDWRSAKFAVAKWMLEKWAINIANLV